MPLTPNIHEESPEELYHKVISEIKDDARWQKLKKMNVADLASLFSAHTSKNVTVAKLADASLYPASDEKQTIVDGLYVTVTDRKPLHNRLGSEFRLTVYFERGGETISATEDGRGGAPARLILLGSALRKVLYVADENLPLIDNHISYTRGSVS